MWWGSRESRKAAHSAGDSPLPSTASSIPPGSGNAEGLLPGTCSLPRSCTAGALLSFLLLLAVRSCTSWDCTAALHLQAALLFVFPCPSPNPPALSTRMLLKPVMCLQLLLADLLPSDLACALQFKTVQSELPDPAPSASSLHTQLGFPATRLHLPHSGLSCPCFLFTSPLCFCLNPPPFCSHCVQKQLLHCSASGNSPNPRRSHGNTLTTHPLLPVWDRQPGTPCLGEPART